MFVFKNPFWHTFFELTQQTYKQTASEEIDPYKGLYLV